MITLNQYFKEIKELTTTKEKGDEFELFCLSLLKTQYEYISAYKNVWLLKDIPHDIALKLNLTTKDKGIDAIAQLRVDENKFFGIQMKYRSNEDSVVSWTGLSTFVASLYGDYFVGGILITNQNKVCSHIKHRNIQFILLGNLQKLSLLELDKILKYRKNHNKVEDIPLIKTDIKVEHKEEEKIVETIEEEKKFKCEICKFNTNIEKYFTLHLINNKICSEILDYSCTRCGKVYTSKRNLIDHFHHAPKCLPSKLDIDTKELLIAWSNKNEKPFQCKYCPKKFSQTSSKYRHEKECNKKN